MIQVDDAIVIGGGQSGLAVGRYLKREGLDFRILDNQENPGGAWLHAWESLNLFSPADASSLPGWPMPPSKGTYPTRDETIQYLRQYEERYELPVERPVRVKEVRHFPEYGVYELSTDHGSYYSLCVVNATGTWSNPYIPEYPARSNFEGKQIHSAQYQRPEDFQHQKVMIVGGGNSGAQILAEVSKWAKTLWVTLEEPRFLPDDVDGRYLFNEATRLYKARQEGKQVDKGAFSLGDIVMVPEVKEARERGVLKSYRPFERFYEQGVEWEDGTRTALDAVIWCTGFKPALQHLNSLDVFNEKGHVRIGKNFESLDYPGLYFVGYGAWTGYASATLIGVGRFARQVARIVRDKVG